MKTISKAVIDAERLDDFKKVLTYHLVTKIKHHFKGRVDLFYKVPAMWKTFRAHRLTKTQLNLWSCIFLAKSCPDDKASTKLSPWSIVALYNDAGLSTHQVRAIFGKYPGSTSFTIPYSKLIENDPTISVRHHGVLKYKSKKLDKQRHFGVDNCYTLPEKYIQSIFDNKELLERVCNAGSDFYSDRQRRLIFLQINGKKQHYHYKTSANLAESQTEAEKAEAVVDEIISETNNE